MKAIRYFFVLSLLLSWACNAPKQTPYINLAGTWTFQIDSLDQGIREKWYEQTLAETVELPGSMVENGKGNDITVETEWTGMIVDSSWFHEDQYAPYRKPGNIKVPFWLQPDKHYQGAAWYQREVEIPADWADRHITLNLERAHWETQVWVDGQSVGMNNRLGTAHVYDLTPYLTPGAHTLSIRVDNRVKEIDPGVNSHSVSDHTQSNWNGLTGALTLETRPLVRMANVKLFPDVENKQVAVRIQLENGTGETQNVQLALEAQTKNGQGKEALPPVTREVEVAEGAELEVVYPMGETPLLWDEFAPNLYEMTLRLQSGAGTDQRKITFGMRAFEKADTRFTINGRPVFLRGTLECAIFPKTGYPATDVDEWKRIFRVIQAHGLNHMRFHSWCPPEAAFVAADELGVYLQVECSSWANQSTTLGDGKPIDQWLYEEAESIIDAYGNHPSFCMMAYGNEPGGPNQELWLTEWIDHWRKQDPRRVYTGGAGWPFLENADFFNAPAARIQGWGQELNSIINREPPQTRFDFREEIQETPMPYVSHEIGQWCVYPNFKEMDKYTGVLKPKNFEIFQATLEDKGLGNLADSFLLASGKLQALCYKADIEASLRTPGMAGFQLLDLHDFPGQGTALVGVLDPFWEGKGYVSPEEYSRFCNQTVPLVRLDKRVFYDNEPIEAAAEIAHFGPDPLTDVVAAWSLTGAQGETLAEGSFPARDIPWGNTISLGDIAIEPTTVQEAQKCVLTVAAAGFANSWDLWIYPAEKEAFSPQVEVASSLNDDLLQFLQEGGQVLLTPPKGSVRPEKGGDVGVGFSSIFWNTAWTRGQKPHTLGILCDPEHPALAHFPTEYHSNWQWWDAMSHADAILLDDLPADLQPIVRIIDDWFTNRSLGLILEARVGQGKLIVSGVDLLTDQDNRPEAQQLLYSLLKYMDSDRFDPSVSLSGEDIAGLYQER